MNYCGSGGYGDRYGRLFIAVLLAMCRATGSDTDINLSLAR